MPDPASAQPRRVALVIGIGGYETALKLVAPPGDAARMAKLLGGLGFTVLPVFNADFHNVRVALREFYDQLRGADIGLLYFSGHGVQDAARENYLLPTDADLHEPEDLTRFAFSLRRIMADMNARVETGLIFLDACRDNPFVGDAAPRTKSVLASGGGLAKPESLLGGMLIAFASDEGHVALDGTGDAPSPFTDALLRHLPVPGRSVTTALIDVGREVQEATKGRQMPWTLTSLKRDVVLVPAAPVAAPAPEKGPGLLSDASPPSAPVVDPLRETIPDPVIVPTPTPNGPSKDLNRNDKGRLWVLVVISAGLGLIFIFNAPSGVTSLLGRLGFQPEVQPLDCTGLTGARETACRVPDLNSANATLRLLAASDVGNALRDTTLPSAGKAGIVTRLLDLVQIESFAGLSPNGRFNTLEQLALIPQALWLDPAMIAELERAHHTIQTLSADTEALLDDQTRGFLQDWMDNAGYRPRSGVTVYPHFAGFPREDFAQLMQALSEGWGWRLEGLDQEANAAGLAQIRYGTDAMLPLALLMAAQLSGRVPPNAGDSLENDRIRKIIFAEGLRVDVAKVRMTDGQLEIWIGK